MYKYWKFKAYDSITEQITIETEWAQTLEEAKEEFLEYNPDYVVLSDEVEQD